MKKINYLAMSFLAAAFGFASCDDKNDCGCDCNQPIIDRVELTDGGVDSLGVKINFADSTVSGGQTVAVFGENLGGIKSVSFVGKSGNVFNAVLKPAFITDNVVVYTVPDLTEDCQAIYRTAACPDGFALAPFAKVSQAKITMVYNEFANDGDTLKIKGANFIGDEIKVFFYKDAENTEEIESPSVTKVGADKLFAVIPEGVAEGSIFRVQTVAGKVDSPIKLRDRSNILIDFDNNTEIVYRHAQPGENYADLFTQKSYKDGKFEVFDLKASEWQVLSYQPFAPELADAGVKPAYPTVFGPYISDIKEGKIDACNFVVKFEINVNEKRPLIGEAYQIGFFDGANDVDNATRKFGALFTFSKINWNTASSPWEWTSAENFYTDGWMTVSVPLSEFLWNSESRDILCAPDTKCESESAAWGHESHNPYCAVYGGNPSDRAKWGGLGFLSNPYSSGSHIGKGAMAVDNIRLVPDDKNGAYFPKFGFGVPERSF